MFAILCLYIQLYKISSYSYQPMPDQKYIYLHKT